MLPFSSLLAIAGATFVSEDLTIVAVGLAIHDGALPLLPALSAVAIGIYLGDIGLWAAGRFGGRRILASRLLARTRTPIATLQQLADWLDRHPALAILGSRFLPGTRLPLYVAAGVWGRRPWRFFVWMFVAVAIWSPLIVFATALFGRAAAAPLERWLHATWLTRAILASAVLLLLRIMPRIGQLRAWPQLLRRARQWEFWPSWLFNVPVAMWMAWLALRYRSLTLFTAANPGIEDGGFVGESKSAILSKLPPSHVMPWTAIEPASDVTARVRIACETIAARGWTFPMVAKPDVGERGTGVRWVRDEHALHHYLVAEPRRVILQVPHDGPFEAGVFYIRHPGAPHGCIFSITDKRFPVAVGDGHSTLEQLIEAHPRYRLQAAVFRARHAAQLQRIPANGERVPLARAGNHCQGTEFLDGRWLLTPALEAAIDAIARQVDGFYFGRFDVRYRDRAAFMAGRDFAIIELNGVSSEATHIYDPSGSLLTAWRTLMRQWSIAFAIGAANRARGHRSVPVRRLLSTIYSYLKTQPPHAIAD